MKVSVVLLTVTLWLSYTGYSQMKTPLINLRAGINFQNLNGKNEAGNDLKYGLITGLHLGVLTEMPIAPEFYIQPGILFSTKGAHDKDNDRKIKLSYIEIPFNILYKPELGNGNSIIGLGPYLGIAAGGKVKSNGVDKDVQFSNKITAAQNASGYYYKRIDAGVNFICGYEFNNKYSVQLNSQLGLVRINPAISDQTSKTSLKNTGFGLSVGYSL